ncbi:hypothetical protein CDD81_546 [Ophiocordyceps australis]|uniref:Infection structure specific protein n=1 Tax=Ophiocordyceps australis TaxID=1399860 RepID=A0A2C5YGK1_9HYPO|nr:hypothetical protein CDD81_546 [Ophiocordyceps australis]
MLWPTLLLGFTASASAAVNFMAAMPHARSAALAPRQTDSQDATQSMPPSECLSAAQDVLTTFPTPPAEIQSELIKLPQSDPCSFSTPASLSSQFAQFSSDVVEWMSMNQNKLSACPALASFNSIATCNKAKDGSDAADATETANAGPRETGMAMAALAAAGFAVLAL